MTSATSKGASSNAVTNWTASYRTPAPSAATFRDPENNPTEVFWLTGHTSWAQVGIPIDIDQPDEAVMADVLQSWETVRDVEMGQPASPETVDAIRELSAAAAGPPVSEAT